MKPFKFSIRGALQEFERLTNVLNRFLEENRVSEGAAYSIHLAIEELVSNVIRHGSDNAELRTVGVAVHLEPGCAVIRVADDGPPFDPTRRASPDLEQSLTDRKPGGLGIHLVRSVAESVRYERKDGWNHTEVTIGFAAAE